MKWPGETLVLPGIPAKAVKSTALTGGKVKFAQTANQLEVFLPKADHAELDTVIALEFASQVEAIPLCK